MMRVRAFVADLARAGKSFAEIKKTVDAAYGDRSLSPLTMDKALVSYFTPETKRMSKEWTLKGKPGPLKAKVQASHSKQMVFAFFDSCGLIYTHIASRSATINAPFSSSMS
jgi:hypothetical protein